MSHFSLSYFFAVNGRLPRSQFLLYFVLPFLLLQLIVIVVLNLASHSLDTVAAVILIVGILIVISNLCGSIRRLHDRDKSGWFFLICFAPFIGAIWLLFELYLLKGTTGPNRYGDDPLMAQYNIRPEELL